jgi:hypothetical protein
VRVTIDVVHTSEHRREIAAVSACVTSTRSRALWLPRAGRAV